MGLESLNESLPDISADLVYRNGTIEFRPTFEELKNKYYTEISQFITIPLKFVGVGPEQNSKHLGTVYAKAEELFSRVNQQRFEYMSWTALGNLDVQSYIEANFTSVQDWDDNF
jgi:dynein heavy chain 2, cytosolic